MCAYTLCILSDTLEHHLQRVVKTENLRNYWLKKLKTKSGFVLGVWVFKCLHLLKEQNLEDPGPISAFLRDFLVFFLSFDEKTCSDWPTFLGMEFYETGTSPVKPHKSITIPVSHPPILQAYLTTEQTEEIENLVIASIFASRGRGYKDPRNSEWMMGRGQGAVLRIGNIHETVGGLKPPFISTPKLQQTRDLENCLREWLPNALTQRGMLLVRATNLEDLPETATPNVSGYMPTPWHTDLPAYGTLIFGVNIRGDSVLLFSKSGKKEPQKDVRVWLPDFSGAMWRIEGDLTRAPWIHGVPASGTPRISITWRPFTVSDPKGPTPEIPYMAQQKSESKPNTPVLTTCLSVERGSNLSIFEAETQPEESGNDENPTGPVLIQPLKIDNTQTLPLNPTENFEQPTYGSVEHPIEIEDCETVPDPAGQFQTDSNNSGKEQQGSPLTVLSPLVFPSPFHLSPLVFPPQKLTARISTSIIHEEVMYQKREGGEGVWPTELDEVSYTEYASDEYVTPVSDPEFGPEVDWGSEESGDENPLC